MIKGKIEMLRKLILAENPKGVIIKERRHDFKCFDDWELKRVAEYADKIDDSGVLELLYLHAWLKECWESMYVSVECFFNANDIANELTKIHEIINDDYVKQIRASIVSGMASAIETVSQHKSIGSVDGIEKELDGIVSDVIEGSRNIRFEVYEKSGRPVGRITNFTKDVKVCKSLAECVSSLENSADGIYVCFIQVIGSLDGWFGYFVKSNGNIFSFNDRINEAYVGQHRHLRNGRYAEDSKSYELFPYELCKFSEKTDYKGYSTSVGFGEQTDILLAGDNFSAFMRTIMMMSLIAKRYCGKTLGEEAVIIDSLLPNNLQKLVGKEGAETALVVIGGSQLAKYHSEFKPMRFDEDKVLRGDYNAQFNWSNDNLDNKDTGHFRGINQDMVDAYGDGFKIDTARICETNSSQLLLGDGHCNQEFIGGKKRYELRQYADVRRQLANYIRKRMDKDYAEFGFEDGLKKWYVGKLKTMREKILSLCADAFLAIGKDENSGTFHIGEDVHQEGAFGCTTFGFQIRMSKRHIWTNNILANMERDGSITCELAEGTVNRCFKFEFGDYKQVEEFLGFKLPKFCVGWRKNDLYNGNCLLDVCDEVGELVAPFKGKYNFDFTVGFSVREIKKQITKMGKAVENDKGC